MIKKIILLIIVLILLYNGKSIADERYYCVCAFYIPKDGINFVGGAVDYSSDGYVVIDGEKIAHYMTKDSMLWIYKVQGCLFNLKGTFEKFQGLWCGYPGGCECKQDSNVFDN
jgi:hypothetical protein